MSRKDEEIDRMLREIPDVETDGEHLDDRDLVAYARGRVDDDRREPIEAHLATCAECRALAADYGEPVSSELSDFAKGALKQRRSRRWPAVATIAVAAAALLFVFLPRPDTTSALPSYALNAPLGGVVQMRGDEAPGDVFVPTSRVRWLLRPSTAPNAPVRLRVFVSPVGAPEQLVEVANPAYDVGATGIVRYEADAEALLGRDFGTRTIHFALTSEGEAAAAYSGARDALTIGPHQWLTSRLDYRARAPKEETP
ncbi:MAG: zf-HC2 domain-containing protein [Deltaproteobacteria bacterium]